MDEVNQPMNAAEECHIGKENQAAAPYEYGGVEESEILHQIAYRGRHYACMCCTFSPSSQTANFISVTIQYAYTVPTTTSICSIPMTGLGG